MRTHSLIFVIHRRLASSRGAALAASMLWLGMIMVTGTGLISITTSGTARVTREENSTMALNAAEAGINMQVSILWRPFKISQRYTDMDSNCTGASTSAPKMVIASNFQSDTAYNIRYTVGVVNYTSVSSYQRLLTIQSVGWIDSNKNGALDSNEISRAIECQVQMSLIRSKVFDYAYFVNNYGWMNGFGAADLIVNGDMRANADFDFSGGTPTINGSVFACPNNKLIPPATGIVNLTPTRWDNSYYSAHAPQTARQTYKDTYMGAKGSDDYEKWRDLIYDKDASLVRGMPSGAVIGDKNGTRSYSGTVLDPKPTTEVLMPDLNDISYYISQSQAYIDDKSKYLDGSNNAYYGQQAYIEIYNSTTNKYERVTTNGVYTGSLAAIGTTAKPVLIHGPVTITGDLVIKGVVQGQGCLYAGRNIHMVGDITYSQAPNFSGNDPTLVDKANEKKDMLALAARGSMIMGNTTQFTNTELQYMTPPFTKARYDDNGTLIPAYNGKERDYTGKMRYQSTFSDAYINSISEDVNQINAILYTNFLGGGRIGGGNKGVTFNGSIISRDEAMVTQSLPLVMNYDNRLRWRAESDNPLIDVKLPLSAYYETVSWGEIR